MGRTSWIVVLAALLVFPLSACQPAEQEASEVVIYSGRSKALVDDLVEQFEAQHDIDVSIKYGTDAQLMAALEEEGDQSPADLFWANTTGALGAASNADLLQPLPDSILQTPGAYVPSSGQWVPVTSRFRVLAYNTDRVDAEALPASVMDLPSRSQYAGRIGWTPAYSSFQDFVTAMRALEGEDATRTWLEGMQDLDPKAYASNTPMLQALAADEIDLALTNHYYVLRLTHGEGEAEEDEAGQPSAPVATYFFESGDVGNLALVTGAGLLQTSDQDAGALQVLEYLLSPEAQRFAAQEVNEYPVVSVEALPEYMVPADSSMQLSPGFEVDQLRDLDATLDLLREVGLL
ncbi:MAG: extracellular solute-binding protein [Bacteroidetes bacterium]|jgi:iron(III) transport system substrate-binding protein|nr:extracellular solute-binding protein [Bacteroidota bacterium]